VGARYVVLLAIAAENDWRLSSSTSASASSSAAKATTRTASGCARTTGAAPTSARTASYRNPDSTTARSGTCATTAETTATAAKIQAPNIALAHSSVPGGLDLTGSCVDCDAVVDAVIDENVGIGTTAERAVLVADHRGLIGRTASIIVAPLTLHRREIHPLCFDGFYLFDGGVGTDPAAGRKQGKNCSPRSGGVV